MKNTVRKGHLLALAFSVLGGLALAAWTQAAEIPTVRVIRVSAKRYEFVPSSITIKRGESIDLELVSGDVPMGFNVPDLGVRSSIIPGAVSHLQITPQKTGTYPFLCDVFCGSGHEDMNGVLTVIN